MAGTEESNKTIRLRPIETPMPDTRPMQRPAGTDPRHSVADVLARDLLDDTVSDRYHVVESLGRGGMGEVSRILDTKIGREIAIKSMLPIEPKFAGEARSRFLREARIQALLEHPAIVPVYDIGFDGRGLPFIAMKRVHGETLFQIIEGMRSLTKTQRRSHTRHRLLSAFVTVCQALHYAHTRGVVHRDLKPDNIMLGKHGEVYLLDWGVAKLTTAHDDDEPIPDPVQDTNPGDMVGTPGYMSPEQVLGQLDAVDGRSDVFALGAILYELLSLEHLIPGATSLAVLDATLDSSRAPAPPYDLPPELYALALRATRNNPDERPQSAYEMAMAVERYLDGDRDEELRKKLAEERASEARELASVALDGPREKREAARSRAMREAGRALALLPQHEGAQSGILRLFATPPDELPAAARAEASRLEQEHLKKAMRDNVWRTATWLALFPLVIFLGPRMPLGVALIGALILLHLGMSIVMLKRNLVSGRAKLVAFAVAAAYVASLSLIFGPFILVPGFASAATTLYVVQASPRFRRIVVGLGLASFSVPFALELAGLLPPSMAFHADGILLLPRLTEFPRAVVIPSLFLVSLVSVVLPSTLALRLRDALLHAEERLVLQKWQLSQLIPSKLGKDA